MDQTAILRAQQKAEEEQQPGFWERRRRQLDRFLQENVANPYGDVGAGVAAGVSAAGDVVMPNDRRIDEPLAGTGPIPPNLNRPLQTVYKSGKEKMDQVLRDTANKYKTDSAQYRQVVEAYREAGDDFDKFAKLLQPKPTADEFRKTVQAEEQMKAFAAKPKIDATVRDASSTADLPRAMESAKQYETAAEEWARKNKK